MPHIHDLYDYVVSCFIVHDHKVLFVRHPRYDKWLCPGGHIELTEDPDEALIREIQEETGLEVEILSERPILNSPDTKNLWQPAYVDVHEANLPHKHIGLVYFAKSLTNKAKLSNEHREIKWLSRAELRDEAYGLSPAMIFYAEAALEKAEA